MADDWLTDIPDETYIANLSIPGTHDSGTGHGFTSSTGEEYSRCQDLTLTEQLEIGIRAFDFRPKVSGDHLHVNHGITATNLRFDDALFTLRDFLKEHPTEFAILHLLYATGFDNDKEEYAQMLAELVQRDDLKDYFVEFRRDLTLGDMRGKMLILSRDEYAEEPVTGAFFKNWCGWIDWKTQTKCIIAGKGTDEMSSSALFVQDQAATYEEGKMDEKKRGIQEMLDYTTTHFATDTRQMPWVYNFLSAYSKVGILDISLSDGYRDNASITNALMIEYLENPENIAGPTGIVLMDYAGVSESNGYSTRGDELVDLIINNNFNYIDYPAPETGGAVSFKKEDNRNFTNRMGVEAKNTTPILADFDGNGLTDIYHSGETWSYNAEADSWNWGDHAFISLNYGAGSTQAWAPTRSDSENAEIPVIYSGQSSCAFDFNQDGAVDFMAYDNTSSGWSAAHPNIGGARFRLFKNNGDGTGFTDVTASCDFSQFTNSSLNGSIGYHAIAVADVNLDGYPDILLQDENHSPAWERTAKLYINQQGEGFKLSEESEIIPANSGSVLFGDFNNDGYPDAIVSGYANDVADLGAIGGGRLDFYKNDGKGNLKLATTDLNDDINWTSQQYGHFGNECGTHVFDFDQDGKLDILIVGGIGRQAPATSPNGKSALLLRNISTGDKFAFEEIDTQIHPSSGSANNLSIVGDFNGDGFVDYVARSWGLPSTDNPGAFDAWGTFCSYSTGVAGEYQLVNNIMDIEDNWMACADMDGDGMLDFMSPYNNDNGAPMFYRNTTLVGGGMAPTIQVAESPATEDIKASYDQKTKRLTLEWEDMYSENGSKAIYNVYIVKDGKTFMRCPAVKETGKQTAYSAFGSYLNTPNCFFENLEYGTYEIGIQSVAHSWNASPFVVNHFTINKDGVGVDFVQAEPQSNIVDVYSLSGIRVKAGVERNNALEGLQRGIYIVGGKKVIK